MSFIPLHTYSGYSYLKSGFTIHSLGAIAQKKGYRYLGLSDFESMSGYPELFHLLEKTNITPIFGLDLKIEEELFSCFVQNEIGYQNAIWLNYEISRRDLTLEDLKKHQEGLKVVLSSEYSKIRKLFISSKDEAFSYLKKIQHGFKSFYLGIPYIDDTDYLSFLRFLHEQFSYDTLAFPHILYKERKDAIVLEMVKAIADGKKLDEQKMDGENYFLSQEEAEGFYQANEIEACSDFIQDNTFVFLKKRGGIFRYITPDGSSDEDYLRKLSKEGLLKKKPDFDDKYLVRLNYELDVIIKMGYASYFLIVADFIHYAKTHDIEIGPGRGSAAGSLVSYALDIITPDPVAFDCLFERFLNPERKSMPDIDVDINDLKRDALTEYIVEKYGKDKVAKIVAFQTIQAKQSLRDTARVFSFEENDADLLSKTLGYFETSLGKAYKENKQFKEIIDSDDYFKNYISLAHKIEGLPRQSGQHAAGIVLNDQPLISAIPIKYVEGTGLVVSYEGKYLEEQGFLKMDLLALSNLSTISNVIELVEISTGRHLDYQKIPFQDEKAIALIQKGETMGIFQLDTVSAKNGIKIIEPSHFEEVVDLLALNRPGPMASMPTYAKVKKGLAKPSYLSPELEPILKSTNGIIIYQEQIMQIAQASAGFTLGEADLFRRAISKKDPAKILALKDKFISGCLAKGHSPALAEKLYQLIYRFADYGFNKSHSLVYAILACQEAYLKAYYPSQFYASFLNGCDPRSSTYARSIAEARRAGIQLALPDVNVASYFYSVDHSKLIFPLSSIRSIPANLAIDIVKERENHGLYTDLYDFAKRLKPFGLNLPELVKLAEAGALDSFSPTRNRSSLRASAAEAMNYAELFSTEDGNSVLFDFELPKPTLADVENEVKKNLVYEKEALGIMISSSPLSIVEEELKQLDYLSIDQVHDLEAPASFTTVGIIKGKKVISTKKGSKMCFLSLFDETDELELTVFSDKFDTYFSLLQNDNIVYVKGHIDNYGKGSLILDELHLLKEA